MDAPRPPDDNAPVDATPFVGIVGALPGPPRRIRVGRYADLLRTLGLVDPVPASFRFVCAAAWRALAEGVERVDVASSVEALQDVDEALVVCGVAAPPQSPQKAERLWLFDAPEPPAPAGTVPPGMTGVWPWVRLVLPGLPAPVALPPSVLAAGLFATGRVASTYAAEPVPSVVTPSGPDWVRLTPMGRRRVLGLDPPPARPGAVPQFGPGAASDPQLEAVEAAWADARDTANPVATLTRLLHARFGAGVRVRLEDQGVRVSWPTPASTYGGLVLRMGPTPTPRKEPR
jgi:hypothetical protein